MTLEARCPQEREAEGWADPAPLSMRMEEGPQAQEAAPPEAGRALPTPGCELQGAPVRSQSAEL